MSEMTAILKVKIDKKSENATIRDLEKSFNDVKVNPEVSPILDTKEIQDDAKKIGEIIDKSGDNVNFSKTVGKLLKTLTEAGHSSQDIENSFKNCLSTLERMQNAAKDINIPNIPIDSFTQKDLKELEKLKKKKEEALAKNNIQKDEAGKSVKEDFSKKKESLKDKRASDYARDYQVYTTKDGISNNSSLKRNMAEQLGFSTSKPNKEGYTYTAKEKVKGYSEDLNSEISEYTSLNLVLGKLVEEKNKLGNIDVNVKSDSMDEEVEKAQQLLDIMAKIEDIVSKVNNVGKSLESKGAVLKQDVLDEKGNSTGQKMTATERVLSLSDQKIALEDIDGRSRSAVQISNKMQKLLQRSSELESVNAEEAYERKRKELVDKYSKKVENASEKVNEKHDKTLTRQQKLTGENEKPDDTDTNPHPNNNNNDNNNNNNNNGGGEHSGTGTGTGSGTGGYNAEQAGYVISVLEKLDDLLTKINGEKIDINFNSESLTKLHDSLVGIENVLTTFKSGVIGDIIPNDEEGKAKSLLETIQAISSDKVEIKFNDDALKSLSENLENIVKLIGEVNSESIDVKTDDIVKTPQEDINNKTLSERIDYLKDIKKESKFMEDADDRKRSMEEKAYEAGGNNPNATNEESNRKINMYESLCEHIDEANKKLDIFENNYEQVLITMKNGDVQKLNDLFDLNDAVLDKRRIKDVSFTEFEEEPDIDLGLEDDEKQATTLLSVLTEIREIVLSISNMDLTAKIDIDSIEKLQTQLAETKNDMQNLSKIQGAKTELIDDGKLDSEGNEVKTLEEKLDSVTSAVDRKTRAFQEEGQVVDGVVQGEISTLEMLDGQIIIISETLEKIGVAFKEIKEKADIKLNVDMSGMDKADGSITDEFVGEADLKRIQDLVNSLDVSLKGLDDSNGAIKNLSEAFNTLNIKESLPNTVQRLANALNNMKSAMNNLGNGGNTFMTSLKELSGNVEGLTKLSSVLSNSVNKINAAKEAVNNTNKKESSNETNESYNIIKQNLKEIIRLQGQYNQASKTDRQSIDAQIQEYDNLIAKEEEAINIRGNAKKDKDNEIQILKNQRDAQERSNDSVLDSQEPIGSNIAKYTDEWDHAVKALGLYKDELGEIKSIQMSMTKSSKDGSEQRSYKVTDIKGNTRTIGQNGSLIAATSSVVDLDKAYKDLDKSLEKYRATQSKIQNGKATEKDRIENKRAKSSMDSNEALLRSYIKQGYETKDSENNKNYFEKKRKYRKELYDSSYKDTENSLREIYELQEKIALSKEDWGTHLSTSTEDIQQMEQRIALLKEEIKLQEKYRNDNNLSTKGGENGLNKLNQNLESNYNGNRQNYNNNYNSNISSVMEEAYKENAKRDAERGKNEISLKSTQILDNIKSQRSLTSDYYSSEEAIVRDQRSKSSQGSQYPTLKFKSDTALNQIKELEESLKILDSELIKLQSDAKEKGIDVNVEKSISEIEKAKEELEKYKTARKETLGNIKGFNANTKESNDTQKQKSEIKDLNDAYKVLINTEKEYQTLKARENATSTTGILDNEKRRLQELNEEREKASKYILNYTKQNGINDNVRSGRDSLKETKANISTEDISKVSSLLDVADQKMKQLSADMSNFQGSDIAFSSAETKLNALNQSFMKGSIDAEKYAKEVNKITTGLGQTVGVLGSGAKHKDVQGYMENYLKQISNGEAELSKVTTTSSGIQKMTGTWKVSANEVKTVTVACAGLDNTVREVGTAFKTADGPVTKFFQDLKGKWGDVAKYMMSYVSFYDIINVFRKGIETVTELDTALTEMRKVSDESMSSLQNYQKESFGRAQDVGTTASELQNSTADWMKKIVPLYGNV